MSIQKVCPKLGDNKSSLCAESRRGDKIPFCAVMTRPRVEIGIFLSYKGKEHMLDILVSHEYKLEI